MVSEKDVIDYYDKIYGNKGVNAMRPLAYYGQVFSLLGAISGRRIVDIGTGTGHLLKVAKEAGLEIYGSDISPEAIRVSRENVPDAHLKVAPGENLPFENNYFDYVVCFGSLEHFLDMDKGVAEMLRVAKESAKFMIVVPNKNYFLWKMRGEYGTRQQDLKETLMNYKDWTSFFSKNGLVVKNVYHDPWPWQSLKIFKYKNPIKIAKRLMARTLWLFMPIKYTYQFIFILEKK